MWNYKSVDGVAFKLAILDKRRLGCFMSIGGRRSFEPARNKRSMSSSVFPCVSGTMKMIKNTETIQINENIQNTPYVPKYDWKKCVWKIFLVLL